MYTFIMSVHIFGHQLQLLLDYSFTYPEFQDCKTRQLSRIHGGHSTDGEHLILKNNNIIMTHAAL